MEKILAKIGIIIGLSMIFASTILIDLETTYTATSIALLFLGLIITFTSGSYLGIKGMF
jgi:hypothetical protein